MFLLSNCLSCNTYETWCSCFELFCPITDFFFSIHVVNVQFLSTDFQIFVQLFFIISSKVMHTFIFQWTSILFYGHWQRKPAIYDICFFLNRLSYTAAEINFTRNLFATGNKVSSIGNRRAVSIAYTAGLGRSVFLRINSHFICS